MTGLRYVLVTPARNEAAFIERTIRSMMAQTVKPLRWVIVSDGSTDETARIVAKYAEIVPWIELVRLPYHRDRNYAAKVHAFNAGLDRVQGLPYAAVANLDADLSFDPDYFEYLLARLSEDSELGLIGTPFQSESGFSYDYRYVSIEHVSGACQLFRRECFEQISGYTPVKGGGIDVIAVVKARMRGWKTRTFLGKVITHHRELGTAEHGLLTAKFRAGAKDYLLGNSLFWEMSRFVYQIRTKPRFAGAAMLLAGYLWSMARRVNRPMPAEFIEYRQREQRDRLRNAILRKSPFPPNLLAPQRGK